MSEIILNRTVEWDSSKENNPDFLISYYRSEIEYWKQFPEHISKKIIANTRKAIKRVSKTEKNGNF